MALLQDAEAKATALIEDHRDQITCLVLRLEAEETFDLSAIRQCLDPDSKIKPLARNRT